MINTIKDKIKNLIDEAIDYYNNYGIYENLRIPKNIKVIEDKQYASKYLKNIVIHDNVISIGDKAFQYNSAKNVKLGKRVQKIGAFAFNDNEINSITFPDELSSIGKFAFSNNKLSELRIPPKLTSIEDECFSLNSLSSIIFTNTITKIGAGSFSYNELKNVELTNGIIDIGARAFSNNELVSIVIPSSVEKIGKDAFSKNPQLAYIKYGLTEINSINNFTNLKLYDDLLIVEHNNKTEYIIANKTNEQKAMTIDNFKEKFGNINKVIELFRIDDLFKWEKLFTSKKDVIDTDILKKLGEEIIINLPATRENANLVKQGITEYNNIKQLAGFQTFEENSDLFKMCYSLGLFSGDKHDSSYIAEYLKQRLGSKTLNGDIIHQIFDTFNLSTGYNKDKASLILSSLSDHYYLGNPEYIARINNEYKEIKKYIEKEYKEIIGRDLFRTINSLSQKEKLNTEEKKELSRLQEELKNYQRGLNKPGLREVKYYIENNLFKVRAENRELLNIVTELKGINQATFDKMQDIYEKAKGLEKEIIQTRDTVKEGYSYQWSSSDNPSNLSLGYKLHCCAKISGAGEDIMVQAMINPLLQNLIIRDDNQNIVAKSTVYYNKEEQYMLFNNAEALSTVNKTEAIKALKRAVSDQIQALRQQGIELTEVRIGMLRNDLFSENDIEIVKDNLLDNYHFANYSGDANDKDHGQGILYQNLKKDYDTATRKK